MNNYVKHKSECINVNAITHPCPKRSKVVLVKGPLCCKAPRSSAQSKIPSAEGHNEQPISSVVPVERNYRYFMAKKNVCPQYLQKKSNTSPYMDKCVPSWIYIKGLASPYLAVLKRSYLTYNTAIHWPKTNIDQIWTQSDARILSSIHMI